MARISGVVLPNGKHIVIALTYIYGIGSSNARKILKKVGITETVKIEKLSESELDKIRDEIKSDYVVEGDLRRLVVGNIKRLKEIRCYKGIRHQKRLPVRGQRTKTNARTRRRKK